MARRTDKSYYEELLPGFWETKFFNLVKDDFRIWIVKVVARPHGAEIPDLNYVDFRCDVYQLKAEFPEQDEEIDAETARILSKRNAT
jgi:hypothetical protein